MTDDRGQRIEDRESFGCWRRIGREHGAGGKERKKEAGKQGGWEAESYISSRLKGGSSTVGGVRLEAKWHRAWRIGHREEAMRLGS
jgi:hypothetical protein